MGVVSIMLHSIYCYRRLASVLASGAIPKRLTSTYECCTKPSERSIQEIRYSRQAFLSIRRIPFSALNIEKQPFGKGVFGKCFSASMSAHINVCVKAFCTDKRLVSVFPLEAVITSNLCHSNLPWLYGITEHSGHKMLVLSFHGVGGRSIRPCTTIHRILVLTRLE